MDTEQISERGLYMDSNNIRFSNSPARRAQVQQVQSPTKSIHPQYSALASQLESIDNQPDYQHRTIDFFDDDSDMEDGLPRAITTDNLVSRSRSRSPAKRKQLPPSGQSFASRCEPKRVGMKALEPESEGYERVDSTLHERVPRPDAADTESYAGSVDEFLPRKSEEDAQAFKSTARLSSTNQFRTSGLGWKTSAPQAHQSIYDGARASSMYSDKIDQRLGVHQKAYEMLIQGMLSDQELMNSNHSPLKDQRASALPAALRTNDPRSPRDHLPANSSPEQTSSHRSGQSRKRAHFVPPPIDVNGVRHSLPPDLIRTPYPHSASITHSPHLTRNTPSSGTSPEVLNLSIRRSNSNSRSRTTTITIPPASAAHSYSAHRTNEKGLAEEHCQAEAADFDDETLALSLRKAYKSLAGPSLLRLFSARSLSRIIIGGPDSHTRDAECGRLLHPQRPTVLAHHWSIDSFSEENLLELFRKPKLGRGKFAFVQWARSAAGTNKTCCGGGDHATAAAPPGPDTEVAESSDEADLLDDHHHHLSHFHIQPKTVHLEFILHWSARRISLALLFIILLAVAACLLWIFLGKQSAPGPDPIVTAGFRGAGDRVGTGLLMGVMVLLVGLTGLGGWLGLSWLVM
ncbi:hypothetical protein Slin15195_G098010 [Septoria linicola]|uniref:Uncharacterized protein n=1 Tax=Septoria linicola TaxID=215465 RepID=A0A9Q9AV68_9PEZI|nr:hypothetical protein Slin15195_G098010 [Septoria linicola]